MLKFCVVKCVKNLRCGVKILYCDVKILDSIFNIGELSPPHTPSLGRVL